MRTSVAAACGPRHGAVRDLPGDLRTPPQTDPSVTHATQDTRAAAAHDRASAALHRAQRVLAGRATPGTARWRCATCASSSPA